MPTGGEGEGGGGYRFSGEERHSESVECTAKFSGTKSQESRVTLPRVQVRKVVVGRKREVVRSSNSSRNHRIIVLPAAFEWGLVNGEHSSKIKDKINVPYSSNDNNNNAGRGYCQSGST